MPRPTHYDMMYAKPLRPEQVSDGRRVAFMLVGRAWPEYDGKDGRVSLKLDLLPQDPAWDGRLVLYPKFDGRNRPPEKEWVGDGNIRNRRNGRLLG